ncbi:hypothetical protein DFH05DRAFT_1387811, partial [Lentinula detonsa]
IFKVSPPDRGSLPLDHYGYKLYINCLKINPSTSTACRDLSKEYLHCRMNRRVYYPVAVRLTYM